ncbi:uncharacterized protein LOC110696070 [Chenopodium quinoa]|uniref:uncharacterized protein LOC110696070 n=1 Tax=Chenopodium quinoa TaxID=63459 RepID=UPI000B796D65|nr:uncharacterized protein LOC110696070 [Chenopodium quinoa]
MVKLASARESRLYGPRLARNRSEYMNAGLYLFGTIVLLMGFIALFSKEPKSGLLLLLIGYFLITAVNVHDLVAHLAGIDYRLPLMEFDIQLALVEFAVPVVQILGSLLSFLGILFLLILEEKGVYYSSLERHALNMLIAGPVLWLIGSIHNSCQIYERADGHIQILQESVNIPFLLASLLFVVGAILNSREQSRWIYHGLMLLGKTWVWLGIFGSLLLFIGGLMNVVKVFKMQQMNGLRLEKLRGGAQEGLIRVREGRVPLMNEENLSSRRLQSGAEPKGFDPATPYKDVLVGNT